MRHAIAITLTLASSALGQPPPAPVKADATVPVLKLQLGFVDAFSKGSAALADYMEPLLADDAVVTDHTGRAYGKAAFVERAKAGTRGPLAMEQSDVKAQANADTVVVTGLVSAKGLPQEGFRFTAVYVKGRGKWQMAALQLTTVTRP